MKYQFQYHKVNDQSSLSVHFVLWHYERFRTKMLQESCWKQNVQIPKDDIQTRDKLLLQEELHLAGKSLFFQIDQLKIRQ